MRKLWPYLGIALAVAVGIALAPYIWWVAGLGIVLAGVYSVIRVGWQFRGVLGAVASIAALVALFAWPVWLWRLGDVPNALAALVIVLVLLCWPLIRDLLRAGWVRVMGPD